MIKDVANAPGKDYHKKVPNGYDSWIDYWEKKRKRKYGNADASFCRRCKNKPAVDGGHVECCIEKNDGDWYYCKNEGIFIVPLCEECNNPYNTEHFQVNKDDLVAVPEETIKNR